MGSVVFDMPEDIHFTVSTHDGSGINKNGDETPKFYVFEENNDTPLLGPKDLTQRTSFVGLYRGEFHVATTGGFDTSKFYDVVASAKVDNIVSIDPILHFHLRNVYYADIQFTRDQANIQDEYTVQWFRNDTQIAPSSTFVRAVKRVDGTDLVATTVMTQIGSLGIYKKDELTNRLTVGEAIVVHVSGMIDGEVREWKRLISRDSI
jgi:hypothetical protein